MAKQDGWRTIGYECLGCAEEYPGTGPPGQCVRCTGGGWAPIRWRGPGREIPWPRPQPALETARLLARQEEAMSALERLGG